MADEELEDVNDDEEESGSPLIKKIIIAVVVLIIIGGGVFGWLIIKKDSKGSVAEKKVTSKKQITKEKDPYFGQILSMDPFIVNLSDPGGKRYLKTKIDLELAPGNTHDELDMRIPQIRDAIIILLSSKTMEQIQGTTGKIALRNDLIMRINHVLKKSKVRNLYFTEFVVQ